MSAFFNASTFRNTYLPLKVVHRSNKRWIFIQSILKCKNEPVKYSASKAASWKAEYTRSGLPYHDTSPWYQPLVISFSIGIFLLYFCVLREENDIDETLAIPLTDRIDGLEKAQLNVLLDYYLQRGMETREVKKRLEEIELENK